MNSFRVPMAIVHHANQYLITNGYINRPGISDTIGPTDGTSGLRAVLELHSKYEIPFHLHISGTLIEASAWFEPLFLEEISDLWQSGLIELIGSAYAQNIMPLFSREFNSFQLEEELRLYKAWLGPNIHDVKGFWIPERVWDTDQLAETVTDPTLSNGGFQYVLADDRLFLQGAERTRFDKRRPFRLGLYKPYSVKGTQGLLALPISTQMRLHIPFSSKKDESKLNGIIAKLLQKVKRGRDVIAIYGDDMEKAAGIPPMWAPESIAQYERFLIWIKRKQDIQPVLLSSWLNRRSSWPARTVGPGTYMELAGLFGAGEDYSGWARSPAWIPYQQMIEDAWEKVSAFSKLHGESPPMLEMAIKHLMASSYETAWHDPGTNWADGAPAPWARALASHARAAYVLLEAAKWQQDTNATGFLQAQAVDLDGDGYEEVVMRNRNFAVVISPKFGGRIIYAFSFNDKGGSMFIGNPSDDWNLLEELNSFMDTPMNHPGALADYGFEHDIYEVEGLSYTEEFAEVVIVNKEANSSAYGLKKRFVLKQEERKVSIQYEQIPAAVLPLSLDIGLSPGYLGLLREGRASINYYREKEKRGIRSDTTSVWVYPETDSVKWNIPRSPIFGHGVCVGLAINSTEAAFSLGADDLYEA